MVFGSVMRNHIPEELRSDPLFQRVVCAITTEPIRDPVVDPTVPAQDIVYEKNALIRWLKSNPTSPYTRLPLSVKKCEFTGDSPLKLQIIYQLHKYQKIISEGLRAGKLQAELSSKEEE